VNDDQISPKRKIIVGSKKFDGKYCFKSNDDHYRSRNTRYYGSANTKVSTCLEHLRRMENFDTGFSETKSSGENYDIVNNEVYVEQAAQGCSFGKCCLKTLKVIKSIFFMLTLIFFALFKQKYGNGNINLYLTYGFAFLALLLDGIIEGFLYCRYKKLVPSIPGLMSFINGSYLYGILCLLPVIVLLSIFKKSNSIASLIIMCLFSAASCSIAISYLTLGCLFYHDENLPMEKMSKNSCCCKNRSYMLVSFFILLVSSFGFIALVDLKIYNNLISTHKFITIPWSAISLALIIAHSIILIYYLFLKVHIFTYNPMKICDKNYMKGTKLFIGWDRCLYFVLELLISLKLDDFSFKETNWFFILMPAYLVFMTRVFVDICYGNDIYEISSK
jgi:hypothetical protein